MVLAVIAGGLRGRSRGMSELWIRYPSSASASPKLAHVLCNGSLPAPLGVVS